MPKPNNKGLEPRSGTGKDERREETYNEDWRGRIDPWELSEDGQVSKVVDGEVPQHPHRCERMERIQKHHPYEKANRASGTGPLVDTRPHISTHAAGEKAHTKDECPRSPAKKGEAMRDTRMSQGKKNSPGVPWILEPGDPVRVPLHYTRPIQHGLYEPFSGYEHP